MNQPLISIIVPLYNLQQYVDKCLESIYFQSYKNWECIIVDDHSSDDSGKISKEWCKKDNRFKYILNSENKGVSYSRNTGLSSARGEYITFVDADDWIDKNFLYDFIISLDGKTLIVQDLILEHSSFSKSHVQGYKNETLTLPQDYIPFLSNFRYTQGYACNKLFNMSIIRDNHLTFELQTANEDEIFYFNYIKSIKKIKFLDTANYHYLQRENSRSRAPKFIPFYSYLEKSLLNLNYLEKILNKNDFITSYKKRRFNAIFQMCLYNSVYYNNYQKSERISYLKKLSKLVEKHNDLINEQISLPKKIDLFLLKYKLYYFADLFIKIRI